MVPFAATGAANPAEKSVFLPVHGDPTFRDPPLHLSHSASDALAEHILSALAHARDAGRRGTRIEITRPCALAQALRLVLEERGVRPTMRPARLDGHATLTLEA
jgi:hypothetical protein